MKVLLIDAYDSFVYIINDYLHRLGLQVTVVRNDKLTPDSVAEMAPAAIVLGPGPGHPGEANYLPIIERFAGKTPIMGVCLGHQAIGMAFGGKVVRAQHLMHGRTSAITHDGLGCFADLPSPFTATRYHSLIVEQSSLPADGPLVVTAHSDDDRYVMGLRHRELAIEGVQFHPESILTDGGLRIFANFFKRHCDLKTGA